MILRAPAAAQIGARLGCHLNCLQNTRRDYRNSGASDVELEDSLSCADVRRRGRSLFRRRHGARGLWCRNPQACRRQGCSFPGRHMERPAANRSQRQSAAMRDDCRAASRRRHRRQDRYRFQRRHQCRRRPRFRSERRKVACRTDPGRRSRGHSRRQGISGRRLYDRRHQQQARLPSGRCRGRVRGAQEHRDGAVARRQRPPRHRAHRAGDARRQLFMAQAMRHAVQDRAR